MKKILICILIVFYTIFYFYGSIVFAADTTEELLINTNFYGNFSIPKPPDDLYYTFFMHTFQNSRYSFVYVFSYNPIEFSIDYNTKNITATSSSSIYQSSFGVGSKNTYISNAQKLDYNDIENKLNSGNYSDTAVFNLTNFSANSIASDITTINNCNIEVVYDEGKLVFKDAEPEFKNPEIQNKDKISNLDFDSMAIFLNDYDSKERLYLHRLEVATTVDLGDGNTVYYYNDKVFGLDFFTSYYNNDPDHPGYTIPKYQFELENNKIYYFLLSSSATSLDHSYNLIDYTKIENAYDGFGVSTSDSFTYEQLQQEQQKKQNDQLEENNKTNKNIFETIKEMLSYLNPFSDNFILLKLWDFLGTLISYINPFSDNFLGKKIVELIGNLLKSLFVPSDEYFNNFFSDLKQWFSDRFGLLFYPFELIIDILNRITNINLSEPKFNIPEIKEPSTGKILFKAQNYNFNDLLDTNEFKIMHDIYFVIVDAIIIFALANLIKSKLKEVETE